MGSHRGQGRLGGVVCAKCSMKMVAEFPLDKTHTYTN